MLVMVIMSMWMMTVMVIMLVLMMTVMMKVLKDSHRIRLMKKLKDL